MSRQHDERFSEEKLCIHQQKLDQLKKDNKQFSKKLNVVMEKLKQIEHEKLIDQKVNNRTGNF